MCNSGIFSETLQNLHGNIEYTLLNDVVFHITMNRSQMGALRGLISALTGIPLSEITNVTVLNPYDYKTAATKYVILDIKVELNHKELINIELQTYRDKYWNNRSLVYLGRTFDRLQNSEDYSEIMSSTQVSIMTYDLFPKTPEFYSHYLMQNTKNGNIYASNFKLNVLCLTNIHLATQEDIDNNLVLWAKLFLAKTWEEAKELAAQNSAIKEAAELMAYSNTDEQAAYLARVKAEALAAYKSVYKSGVEDGLDKSADIIAEKDGIILEKDAALSEKDTLISEKDAQIAALKAQLAEAKGSATATDDNAVTWKFRQAD